MNLERMFSFMFLVSLALSTSPAHGQSSPTYVQFSPPEVKGALYKPDSELGAARRHSRHTSHFERHGKFDLHRAGKERIHGASA